MKKNLERLRLRCAHKQISILTKEIKEMIPVKRLMEILKELPEGALAYAYEGEVIGIVFVSSEDKELGYIPTKGTGADDLEFIKTVYNTDSP